MMTGKNERTKTRKKEYTIYIHENGFSKKKLKMILWRAKRVVVAERSEASMPSEARRRSRAKRGVDATERSEGVSSWGGCTGSRGSAPENFEILAPLDARKLLLGSR